MPADKRAALNSELTAKVIDYRQLSKKLEEDKSASDREFLKKIKPKLNKVIAEISKKNGYDMVLDDGAVVDVKKEYEITVQVIELLNKDS